MTRALSVDLRQRVVAAIDGGLSCRRAAERFGISAASAIRWRSRLKEAGDVVPKRQGGDRRSQRIETHSQLILDAVTVKTDITLAELRDKASSGPSVSPQGNRTAGDALLYEPATMENRHGLAGAGMTPMAPPNAEHRRSC